MIVTLLVLVIAALASAGLFMLRRKPGEPAAARDRRMARALAVRVGLSVTLFLLILLAYALGWIHPTGVPLNA